MPSISGGTADIWAFQRAGHRNGQASPAMLRTRQTGRGASLSPRSELGTRRDTIISLIVVAAALLDSELRGGAFTFEQLVKKMRELLGHRALDAVDVQAVLPDMSHYLARLRNGWQWKRRYREPGYPS